MYFFGKKDKSQPDNFNIRAMHFINKTAIIMFLLGIIWKLIDWFILKRK